MLNLTRVKEKISDILNLPVRIEKRVIKQIYARTNNFTNVSEYGSGSKFPGGLNPGAPIDQHSHFQIRQKVRRQMYDSVEGKALLKSIVDNTIDVGLKLKPVPIPEIIGKSSEELEEWSEKTALRFHLWAKDKKSHRSRVNSFYQNQRLYQLFQQRDNDIFTRFYYGRDKDLFNPLQIEFIDPNQITGYDYTSTYFQDSRNDDGIVRDSAGREIAFKIYTQDTNGQYKTVTIPAIGEKSGRIFMKHGYNPEYAGQGRGYSKMMHLIQRLSDLTDFKISTIQKAINQASFIAAIENEEQDASNPLEGRIAGPIKEYGSTAQQGDTTTDTDGINTEPIINWEVTNEATIRQPGSHLIGNLRRGDKIQYLKDTSPTAQYDKFVESFFASICASTGWAIELVLKKFGNNYSASRGTLLLCWRTAEIERDEEITDFCNPVYEAWLSEEIATGRIQCPGWSDKYIRAAWLNATWAGVPMPNIDPLKTAMADEKYVELGAQDLDDVARNLNGSSGKANRIKLTRQYQELPEPPWNSNPTQNNFDGGDEDNEDK